MENQDKIFEQFKDASKKAEAKDFPAMEKVWARVEEKLDKKEDKKTIAIWKKIGIAASLLLFFTLGYQFLKTDDSIEIPKKPVVIEENTPTISESEKEAVVQKMETAKESEESKSKKTTIIKNKAVTVQAESSVAVADKTNDDYAKEEVELIQIEPKNLALKDAKIIAAEVKINPITKERTVTGTVVDNQNLPLPGAVVAVKGTSRATQTDFDGKYTIAVETGEKLEFSYIGSKSIIASVENNKQINITLQDDTTMLDAVVVTSYSTKKKSKSSSAVAVSEESIKSRKAKKEKTIASSPAEENDFNYYRGNVYMKNKDAISSSLQGRVSGLNITEAKKEYNGDKSIVLRGTESIKEQAKPLYIVDGLPIDEKTFKTINQNEIEEISVLKDASVTSLYGNRGSNGVIVVKTKKGTTKNLSKREIRKKLRELKRKESKETYKMNMEPKAETSQEDYDPFIENPFESPKNEPLSTFSIDVDNASYTNVRRFINNGQTVPKDAVRVEEMVNFFKYNYPQPKGDHLFSINTEYSDAPWNPKHKLVKIGLQGKIIPTEKLPASNLVFLIDVSGSMSDSNKLPLLKQSMKILVNELRKEDKVSIVVYAGAAGMVLPPTSGDNKKTIIDALEKLDAGGSTAGGAGIELAYKTAQENFIKNGNNRVILATDGDFNVGSSSNTDMETLIEEKRKSGVFLTCLGYGMGNYKDSKMQILADKGNGNYAYIDNIQEANRFLGKEFKGSMFAIAKDVKIQIEFNPKHVQLYRLIGYENRKLRPEDFTNDAIDAGELGSGHTVTALYEIIPTGVESEFLNKTPDLKYTKVQENGTVYNEELATIKFRYKKPDGDKSIEMVNVIENKPIPLNNTSDDFKFSAAVAWFGLKLRDSKLIPNKSSEDIKKLAKEGLSDDEDGYKAEFVRLVESVK
ncbi:von Willebrand factor [compost metagenome]